jgi:hypothetical protein
LPKADTRIRSRSKAAWLDAEPALAMDVFWHIYGLFKPCEVKMAMLDLIDFPKEDVS